MAENAWNTRDPERIAGAYAADSRWRNRSEFLNGRDEIAAFLKGKWSTELDYRLVKELWAFDGNHIAVRFQYEWHDAAGQWFRSYGNEQWEFDAEGYMQRCEASINDVPIAASERKFDWPLGPRHASGPGEARASSSGLPLSVGHQYQQSAGFFRDAWSFCDLRIASYRRFPIWHMPCSTPFGSC